MYPVPRTLAALLLLLGSGAAVAHPMGSDMNGHRLELRLAEGELRADYQVEIPTQRMMRDLRDFLASRPGEADTKAYAATLTGELVDGLRLKVNGEPARWEREPGEAKGESDARYVSARVRLRASLPAEARTVQVVNGNLPEVVSLFLVSLRVSDGLVVDDCSLWERSGDGGIARDRDGQWRMEEESRDLAVSFRPRGALGAAAIRWTRRLGGEGDDAFAEAAARAADAPLAGLDARGLVVAGAAPLGVIVGIVAFMRVKKRRSAPR